MGTQGQTELSADGRVFTYHSEGGPVQYVTAEPQKDADYIAGCTGCAFKERAWRNVCDKADCMPWQRADGRNVIWVEK